MVEYQPYQILTAAELNASIDPLVSGLASCLAQVVAEVIRAIASEGSRATTRAAADTAEATARAAAITAEITARIAGDATNGGALTAAIATEVTNRNTAIATEATARTTGDSTEATARIAGDAATLASASHLTGSPSINFGPVGNAFSTNGSFVQQGTAVSANLREFAGSFGLESSVGFGGSTAGINADKVALYAGIEGFAGSGDIWPLNTVCRMAPGFPATGNALGYELDYNNQAQNVGGTDGLAGFGFPIRVGLLVSGASTFSSTAGISVEGGASLQWYRGLGAASGVTETALFDYTTATIGLEMQATHVGYGIDMLGSVLGGAIRLPNNAGLSARNNASTADVFIATVDASNNLEIGVSSGGTGNASGIYMGAGTLPMVSNTYTLGSASRFWTTVYATTGTINTSDPRLKTDIAPVSGKALAVVNAIRPITYRWKVGGMEPVAVSEMQTVQDTVEHRQEGFDIVVKDGTATRVPVVKTLLKEAYDDVPLLDEAGKQIIVHVPARDAWTDERGVVHPGNDAYDIAETHRIPRMVTKEVTVSKLVERPGKRIHAGFSADDVEKIAGMLGLEDFGGYVLGDDGTKHMRPDQMIPILWQALREVSDTVTSLQAQVASLKAA